MFKLESEMHAPTRLWLESQGMRVYEEFSSPSGPIDLVAVKLCEKRLEDRAKNLHRRTIHNPFRVRLVLSIPKVSSRRSVSRESLCEIHRTRGQDHVISQIERLIKERYVIENKAGRLQCVSELTPIHERFVAVELKLSKISEVMRQAWNNLAYADESYIGLPPEVASRVASQRDRWAEHFEAGIGLLSVTHDGCDVLIHSENRCEYFEPVQQMIALERIVKKHFTSNSSSRARQSHMDAS